MANRVELEAILKFVDVKINSSVFTNVSRAAAGMPGPVQKLNQNLAKTVTVANNVQRSVRGINTQLTAGDRIARLFLQRMAQFAILLPTFVTLNKTIQGGVKFLFDFDAAIKDVIRLDVGSLSGRFNDVAKSAFDLSTAFGVSATEAVGVIKTYVQAGYDLTEASEKARLSLLATRSSTLDAAQATEFLLSVSKQFGLEGSKLSDALDGLVKTEGASATSAEDIAEAFKAGGNSFATFGKNIYDGIGLISAFHEQTRKSGSEIGTFFKTIQARIFATGASRSALDALGVSVQNLDGSLRPTLDVLNDLKTAFDGMTTAQQANAAKAIAGTRQFESLLATLKSLDRANQLSVESSHASGTAKEKEAVDAEKLSRRYDDLIVAGEKLAYAIGQAGASDFFKNSLKSVTSMVEGLTSLVNLLDKIKVPVLPILAPLALKGLGTVFGVGGGGGGGGLPGTGGGIGGGGAGGALGGGGSVQAAASMRQLSVAVSQLTQQLRILLQATMTQSQLVQSNIALDELQVKATNMTIASTEKLSVAMQSTSKSVIAQRTLMNTYLPTFKKYGVSAVNMVKSTNNIQNAGAKLAIQYALLTVGTTAVTAGLRSLGDKFGSSSLGGVLSDVTATGVQMAGQFAILGPAAAAVAGSFGILSDITKQYIAAVDDAKKANLDIATAANRDAALKHAPKALSGGVQGLDFLQAFGKTIAGRTNKGTDFNRSLNEAFKTLSPATQAFIKNVDDLKQVLFDPGSSKETIAALSKLDSEAFVNKDALEKLRASYDENGKSTLSAKDQLDLFFHALGQVDQAVDQATGRLEYMKYVFKDMKAQEDMIKFGQSVNNLGRELEEASQAPNDMLVGIGKLRAEAGFAKEDLLNAQKAFAALRDNLIHTDVANQAGLDPAAADKFIKQLNDILNTPNNGAALSKFLSNMPEEEQKFADEFMKIDKDRRDAVINGAKADQALQVEIMNKGLEDLKNQREAAYAASDAMAKFKNELIKTGTASGDTGLTKKITSLSSKDVSNVLAGKSDLSDAIQSVIKDTFVDGVKKAETSLSKVAEETANSIVPVDQRIKDLRDSISQLGEVKPGTKGAERKQALENELVSQTLEKQIIEQDGYVKSLEGLRTLTVETKKANEEEARAEAERAKKTLALTEASDKFSRSIHDVNKTFQEFSKQKIDDLAQKQANAYEEVKSAEQGVLTATEGVSTAYKDYIGTLIQVNGILAEAKIRANLWGRDIGMLNGNIVTFQDRMSTLNSSFSDVLKDANMKLDQRIQLEKQLADQTLSFLQQAQEQITNAGTNVFGQSAQQNQGLQKGIAGLSYIVQQLGGTFKNFLNMKPDQLNAVSEQLLNLPVEFRQEVLSALSTLPSTTAIGGFSADQLKQAIGQVGAGVAPEQGLPAIADLSAKQVDQLKILTQLSNQEANQSLTQVLVAQKALQKAQEQLDIAKIQEQRAKDGFDQVRTAVGDEMAVIQQANIERRDLLQKVIMATNETSLHEIDNQANLFADQNEKFKEVGNEIVTGISQAINAKNAMMSAQTSLGTFNTMQDFSNQAKGFIPNFSSGNLSPHEAAGILHAAAREKRAMPNGAQLAVANTHEAVIPMYKNFAQGTGGSAIAATISNIRSIDQTQVAAIASSVTSTLSQINAGTGNQQALDKIATLLTDLNGSINQVRDSNLAIKSNTAGLSTNATTKGAGVPVAAAGQSVNINLQTNQNSSVQITGLESLRDQLKTALSETTDKQVTKQIEALMVQLDPIFQALSERGIINSFGQSR